MTGERYWKKRAEQRLVQAERASAPYLRKIAARYRKAAQAIEGDIQRVFDTYRQDFTAEEASAFLREEIPMAEYDRLKEILPGIQDERYRKELTMRLNAQSYRYRITRMQYVRQLILARLSEGADYEKRASSELYRETAKEGYLRTLFDIQKGAGTGFAVAQLPEKTIDRLESARWYGRNYSASVWRNRGLVAEAAADVIETGVLAGQSIRRMSREMMEQTCTHSVSNAARLIRTEVNYFCNQGALEGYREAEIEEYEFLATLDLRTSAACRELDGKKFPLAKAQPGKNCPPMHPYCRSTVIPIIDTPGLKRMEKRAARDAETGKSVQIDDMRYEEWYNRFVRGRSPSETTASSQLVLSSGKTGDTDGASVIESVEEIVFSDREAIEGEIDRFAQEFAYASEEHAIVFSPQNRLYRILGQTASVNVDLAGEDALNGAIVIHNHPAPQGESFYDSFSKQDFVSTAKSGTLEEFLISGERKHYLRINGHISEQEAREIYEEAFFRVQEKAFENLTPVEYEQLETMREIAQMDERVIFDELRK